MLKQIKLYWQLLLFPLLFIPYMRLNSNVIVKWLGCGCPQIGPDGKEIARGFNANHFTFLFWTGIGIIVILISIFNLKRISKRKDKESYMTWIVLTVLCIVFIFSSMMRWK
jgi:formate hydrogenlyase subunit 3/multisubunit Na+/H+ antiporter MnhD subunit